MRCAHQWFMVAFGTGVAVWAVSLLADGRSPFGVACLLGISGFLVVSSVRTPLEVGGDEVVVRSEIRTRRLPRCEVIGTTLASDRFDWPLNLTHLVLQMADGSEVTVDRLLQLRDGGAVDRARRLLAA